MISKFLVFAFSFAYLSNCVQAQIAIHPTGKLFDKIALFGGPSIASLRGAGYFTNGVDGKKYPKTGYNFGISFAKTKSEKTTIEFALLFERKGVRKRETVSYWNKELQAEKYGTLRRTYEYKTISISSFYKYQLLQKPKIIVGPGIFASYITSALSLNEVYIDSSGTPYLGYHVNESSYTKFDFGMAGAILMLLPMSKSIDLQLGIADNLGLINTRTEAGWSPTRTNNLCLQVGISFNK